MSPRRDATSRFPKSSGAFPMTVAGKWIGARMAQPIFPEGQSRPPPLKRRFLWFVSPAPDVSVRECGFDCALQKDGMALSYREIAEVFGVSADVVRGAARRIRGRYRELLRKRSAAQSATRGDRRRIRHSSLITTSVRQSSLRQRRCTAKPRVAAGAPGNVESPPSSGFPLLRRTPTGFPQPDAPVRLGRKFPTQGGLRRTWALLLTPLA